VVSDNGATTVKPTTTLPAIIEYFLPYRSKEGYDRTTLKIALGEMVSVNTIIRMSFIKTALN
jgi:hypothetical protein